jgi:hypothetical protein
MLESLVRVQFHNDYHQFFTSLLEQVAKPTFSYSVFCQDHAVPRTRETLRNIVYALLGKPTKHFLAERWKQRIQTFWLQQTRTRTMTTTMTIHDTDTTPHPNINNMASTVPLKVIPPPEGDISHVQMNGRRRGRVGVLDQLVMTKFEGNFFTFLAHVEQQMQKPNFTMLGFVRQHNVPRARAVLSHIVSHLRTTKPSSSTTTTCGGRSSTNKSNVVLAQMWKDRIKVYQEKKKQTSSAPAKEDNVATPVADV